MKNSTLVGALILLAVAPVAWPACPTFPITPGGLIEKRWQTLGGCSGLLGDSLSPERRHLASGGVFQDFERGQIAVHPSWPYDPSAKVLKNFVLSAHVDNAAHRIHVWWEDTAPFEYEFFQLRWSRDDHEIGIDDQHKPVGGFLIFGSSDPQQMIVTGHKSRGTTLFDTRKADGTYIITVEGCNKSGLFGLGTDCPQGWSFPVEVDFAHPEPELRNGLVTLPPPAALPYPPGIVTPPSPPFDLPDGPILDVKQTNAILEKLCADPNDMIENDGGHAGELKTDVALAALRVIRDSPFLLAASVPCYDPQTKAPLTPPQLRNLVNKKIKESTVVSVPGTDVGWIAHAILGAVLGTVAGGIAALLASVLAMSFLPGSPKIVAAFLVALGLSVGSITAAMACEDGDYDMHLVRLIQIAYGFDDLLDPDTKKHLLDDLLTARGGEDQRREKVWICGLPTAILPESENHILMTESSRYLTNQLLAADYKKSGKPVPKEFDNDQNGMTDWFLKHLQSFLQNDFYEYNGRPYAREAMQGISNLYEFAGPFNRSNPCWRSNPPDPAQTPVPRACDVRRAARIVMDYHAARFALGSFGLRRASPYRRQPDQRNYSRLFGRQSDSMTWRYLTLSGGEAAFWQQRYGRLPANIADSFLTPIVGAYRMPQMIAHLMTDKDHSFFQRHFFSRDGHPGVELYNREKNWLISGGGMFDVGRTVFSDLFSNVEDAWALPTTLMPLKEGVDYRHFVRISGSEDENDRVNSCVAPGFACGLNPEVPPGIPTPCTRSEGNWTFLDFNKNSPGCDLDYGFYAAVYREPCDNDKCTSKAGNTGAFGFFEATPYRGFVPFVEDTLAANKNWDFRSDQVNVYKSANGRIYTFQPLTGDRLKWGMVAMSQGGVVTDFETDLQKWPLAQGSAMRSDEHKGCVVIDNLLKQQRLVLDFSDANRPKRTRVSLPSDCGCPLTDVCLPPRYE